jgi:hypothetical protein
VDLLQSDERFNDLVNSDVSGDRIDEIVAQTLVGAWHLTKLFERVDDLKIAICMTRCEVPPGTPVRWRCQQTAILGPSMFGPARSAFSFDDRENFR